ncbi:hypothetical protein NC651_032529 [Populus alba x Populus x berolinensis]|nr:hypothetical protein NC651_032529 [Populus alba x Populus x berolinensis]
MIVCIGGGDGERDASPPQPQSIRDAGVSLADVLVPRGSPSSIHVVIVMDALRGFSWEPLLWALDHVTGTGYTITLLGVMTWIPLPFRLQINSAFRLCWLVSLKTWLDVWTFDLGDWSALKGRGEWKNDQKSQKIRGIIQLCDQKGVVPCMEVAMGHPLKLVVLEQTTSLHATFVVIDRHLKKNRAFYSDRLPSNAVIMNSDGGVDMLKIRSTDLSCSAPEQSPATSNIPLPPQIIISEELSVLLRSRIHQQAADNDHKKRQLIKENVRMFSQTSSAYISI